MKKYQLSGQSQRITLDINGVKRRVDVYQIRAIRDFSDVKAGTPGGWVDSESCLSQHGDCWIYAENTIVIRGARVVGAARITGECLISDYAHISDSAWIDNARVSDGAKISGHASVRHSTVRGHCHIFDNAQILKRSEVHGIQGLTPDNDPCLQIYQQASVQHSRIVHQAQIYGRAMLEYAFVEHRAAVFDDAVLLGNRENAVWVCDCARVYGRARIIAGTGEDQCPTLRYSSQVYGNATVEGDCVLKHHVQVYGDAALSGGPLLLDNHIAVYGSARLTGAAVVEDNVAICDQAQVEGSREEPLVVRGQKIVNGIQRVTRTPFYGVF